MTRLNQASSQDVIVYVQAMAEELAEICENAGMLDLAQYFERAADAAMDCSAPGADDAPAHATVAAAKLC
jgi:hypothetical protein